MSVTQDWCRTCQRPRDVVDEFDEDTGDSYADHVERSHIFVLSCGHAVVAPVGAVAR